MPALLITNIQQLIQVENPESRRHSAAGADMAHLPLLNNAYLLLIGDRIAEFGDMQNCPNLPDIPHIDASNRMVFPSWCDSHTHIVYAQTRETEFVDRIRGLTYEQIAANGGGILNSAAKLQVADEETLFIDAQDRLLEMMYGGTGAVEIKSGYGLTPESELKMLRVARRLKETSPVAIKTTFLGAHAVPAAFKHNREGYIRQIIDEMLPAIARENLAEYIDVFCDEGFFTPSETAILLKAGAKYGLKPKIHANELANSGGVQVGIAHQAISVDHLERIGDAEIAALAAAKTTFPTLLPSCAFFLGLPYAPARRLIDAGLPVVLATDNNPGTTPSGNMSFVLALACIKMRMLPEEAINAATLNGAAALEWSDEMGSIAVGKRANVFITKPIDSVARLPYSFGSNLIETVIVNGKVR